MKKANIIFLLIIALLIGCEDEKVDIVEYGSLSGIVYDGDTNLPLSGALVATSPASSSVLTSETGEFSFNKILAGEVSVTARKKDYISSTLIVSVYGKDLTEMSMVIRKDEKDYGSVTIYDPVPGNGAVDQDRSITMSWKVDQTKSDISLAYDVYLFKSNSSTQTVVGESLTTKQVVVDGLTDNTTYYWYVVAKYEGNVVANSPTWTFKTGDNEE